jgi:hypothetical protein
MWTEPTSWFRHNVWASLRPSLQTVDRLIPWRQNCNTSANQNCLPLNNPVCSPHHKRRLKRNFYPDKVQANVNILVDCGLFHILMPETMNISNANPSLYVVGKKTRPRTIEKLGCTPGSWEHTGGKLYGRCDISSIFFVKQEFGRQSKKYDKEIYKKLMPKEIKICTKSAKKRLWNKENSKNYSREKTNR